MHICYSVHSCLIYKLFMFHSKLYFRMLQAAKQNFSKWRKNWEEVSPEGRISVATCTDSLQAIRYYWSIHGEGTTMQFVQLYSACQSAWVCFSCSSISSDSFIYNKMQKLLNSILVSGSFFSIVYWLIGFYWDDPFYCHLNMKYIAVILLLL